MALRHAANLTAAAAIAVAAAAAPFFALQLREKLEGADEAWGTLEPRPAANH
jgi:hypothetical protein